MFVARMAVLAAAALCTSSLVEAKTLRWASQGDALTLDPHAQNEGPTTAMNSHVYEALISRDPSLAKVPGLALSWKTIASDVWEYKLRPDVKFSDGTPFTADDVVFSYNRALSPSSDFRSYISSIKEVKAIDPLTVHIITDGPNPILPDYTSAILIMSKAWSEKHNVAKPQSFKDKEETFAVRNAMGTGPYTVKQRDPDVRTVLEKNPTYWGAKDFPNYSDELVYTPIKEPATRVAALISGQVDFVLDAPLQDIARIKQTPGLKTEETAQVRSIFLGLDVGSPELKYSDVKGKNPFADKRVRQAMYQAIDINAIKAKVMRNFSAPAGLTTAPGVHGYTKALDERLKYDVAGAKKLMAEAGYPNGFGVRSTAPTTATTTTSRSARRSPACWRRSASGSTCRRAPRRCTSPSCRRRTPACTCWAGVCRRSIRTMSSPSSTRPRMRRRRSAAGTTPATATPRWTRSPTPC